MSETVNRVMGEMAELGGVRPRLLADGTIELRPWPASLELSQKVSEIFERAGMKELRPWVWGAEKADHVAQRRSSRAARVRTLAALALVGAFLGAFVGAVVGTLNFLRARLNSDRSG